MTAYMDMAAEAEFIKLLSSLKKTLIVIMHNLSLAIKYADNMPPDFSTVLMKDYMYIEKDYIHKLMMIPEFTRWYQTKGRLLNGSV